MINKFSIIMSFVTVVSFLQLGFLGQFLGSIASSQEAPSPTPTPQTISCKNCPVKEELSFKPETITFPSLNLTLPVVSVPLEKGTWKVNAKVANFAEGTSLVNSRSGNVGIYGHDRADAFGPIKKLLPGDLIEVKGDGHIATYQVTSSKVVNPQSVDVFYPQNEPILTLITCQGVFSEKRYAIIASLKEIK